MTPVNDDLILSALRGFLLAICPQPLEVVRGQVSRVAQPRGQHIVMTPIRRDRLETNVNDYADIILQGYVTAATPTAPTTLTVTQTNDAGPLIVGGPLNASLLLPGTAITSFLSGTGGTGTYAIRPDQTFDPGTLYGGYKSVLVQTEMTVQLDMHGSSGAENAERTIGLLRDEYACEYFAHVDPRIMPLYASAGRQVPFLTAEDTWEYRWIVETVLQASVTLIVGQQFASELEATVIPPVDLIELA